jgi:hypothetical protein
MTKPSDDPVILRHISDGQYEFVDVTFQAAATDTVIPYTILNPENPDAVRWIDVTPGAINSGGSDSVASVYRSVLPSAKPWAIGYIVLRCNAAGYSTRLKLFLERT